MKLLFDECVPRKVKFLFADGGDECETVRDAGFSGKENGELLDLAEGHFEVDYVRVPRDPLGMRDSRQLSDPCDSTSTPKSQLPRCVVVPTQNSESAQCVPAACSAHIGLHL